ncbi:hypothetical protein HHK36_014376 [Tetracentron sinense]|uniref:Myb-like domain-containing protein n=1 Tax=Tetracentron sinense TaxID=13715 RepID=A0A835DE67_TETSI|nr:hypothetical protein HHK36_014376 [Tetracentron sinense]
MGRRPCCSKEGLNRGAWTALEDKTLGDYIKIHGEGRWRNLPKKAGHQNQSKEKTKPVGQFTEVPSSPKMQPSHVVRTQALRCREVSLTTPKPQRVEHFDTKAAVGANMVRDSGNNKAEVEAESCDGLLSFSTPEEDNSSELMMDLNIGEICGLSNLLDTDFSRLCDFDNAILRDGNYNNSNDLSQSSYQPLLVPEDMLEDWTASDSVHRDMASDLRSLAYLLDSGEEWLGQ